jgi:hypothetical protein
MTLEQRATSSVGMAAVLALTLLGALSASGTPAELSDAVTRCDGNTSSSSAAAGFTTGCPSASSTCCHHKFSHTTWGCCPYPNAVCCAGSYGLCCPEGTTCKSTGQYSGTCEKKDDGHNWSPQQQAPPPPGLATAGAPQVCTPGALDPPSTTMPTAIVIGDSVSIGYTPHVIEMLQGKVQVQHSPAAGGGGADDTPYGEQCIVTLESFLRTAKYEPAKWDVITYNFGLQYVPHTAAGSRFQRPMQSRKFHLASLPRSLLLLLTDLTLRAAVAVAALQ